MTTDLQRRYQWWRREYRSGQHGPYRMEARYAIAAARTEIAAEELGVHVHWVDDPEGFTLDEVFSCDCADPRCVWRPVDRGDSAERQAQIDRVLGSYERRGCTVWRCVDDCGADTGQWCGDHLDGCEELASLWACDVLTAGMTYAQEEDEWRVIAADVLSMGIETLLKRRANVAELDAALAV